VAGIPGAIIAVPISAMVTYAWPYLRGDHDHDPAVSSADVEAPLTRGEHRDDHAG